MTNAGALFLSTLTLSVQYLSLWMIVTTLSLIMFIPAHGHASKATIGPVPSSRCIDPTADEHQVAFSGCGEDIVPIHDLKDGRLPVRTDQDVAAVPRSWLMFDITQLPNALR